MAEHNELGKAGENAAVAYLEADMVILSATGTGEKVTSNWTS